MAKISIMPLGGQDERGKNCVLITINEDIYIFDIGLKLPESSVLGVDVIIPDYEYVYNNIDKVKGIFITNASAFNAGGLQYFIRKAKAPIYCNEMSAITIKHKNLKHKLSHRNTSINIIKDKEIINFGPIKIQAFKTIACSPDSLSYAIHTPNGTIVIMGDFIFDGEVHDFFQTNYKDLTALANNNIIALLIDSEYAARPGFTAPNHKIESHISSIIKEKKKRTIFAIFEEDIFNMYNIIKQAIEAEKKVCLYGSLINELVANSEMKSVLEIKENDLISYQDLDKHDNPVIIMAYSGDVLYAKLAKIALGNDDYVQLTDNDIVVLATPPNPGVEKRHADVLDELARTNADIVSLSEKKLWSMRASFEDVKLMISLLKPKKVIPMRGLYKDFLGTKRAAKQCGMHDGDIIILENGDLLEIFDNNNFKLTRETLNIPDVFVDGIGVGDVSNVILYERRLLGSDGVLIMGVNIDYKTKKISSLIDIQMRGVYYKNEENVLFTQIQEIIQKDLNKIAEDYATNQQEYNLNAIKKNILGKIKTVVKNETKKQPITLLIINEVNDTPRPVYKNIESTPVDNN